MPESIPDILAAFGLVQKGDPEPLDPGDTDSHATRVPTNEGAVTVKTVDGATSAIEEARSVIQERVRARDVQVPRCFRTPDGTYVYAASTVQSFVDGVSMVPQDIGGYAFGRALGRLDRALAEEPIDDAFRSRTDIWSRGRSTRHVREHCLTIEDNRLPTGHREELVATLELVENLMADAPDEGHVLAHADPNPGNAIYTYDGTVVLIDLTFDVHLPGYTLGAAIWWWAHPRSTNRFDPAMADAIASGYRSAYRLDTQFWNLIPAYVMTHAMMALSLPYTVLADGGTPNFSRLSESVAKQQKLRTLFPVLQDVLSDVR